MNDIPFEKVSAAEAKAATEQREQRFDGLKPAPKGNPASRMDQAPEQPDIKVLMPWIQQLPAEIRPKQLIVQYARIANKLAGLWPYPVACERFLNSLMIDERGDRQGFPPEVALELTALNVYYNTHVLKPHYSVWGDRIGDQL